MPHGSRSTASEPGGRGNTTTVLGGAGGRKSRISRPLLPRFSDSRGLNRARALTDNASMRTLLKVVLGLLLLVGLIAGGIALFLDRGARVAVERSATRALDVPTTV